MTSDDQVDDKNNVTIISHILIRDPDTDEVFVKKRDIERKLEHEFDKK